MKYLPISLLIGYASAKEVPDMIISTEVIKSLDDQRKFSMQVCSGLFNREDTDTKTAFALYDENDLQWL